MHACCRRDCCPITDLPAAFATGALVLEDLEFEGLDERALFHLLNLAREQARLRAHHVAFAAARLFLWPFAISPRACARCRAWRWRAPDDALLRALIVKLAVDRQMARR